MDTPLSLKLIGVSIFIIVTLSILTGCSGLDPTQSVYLPPTSENQPALQPKTVYPTQLYLNNNPQPNQPTPGTTCADGLLFIEDITVPDGSSLAPGSVIDKQWQVENNGTCNWDSSYSLRLTSEDGMGAEPEQALYPAKAGTRAFIQVSFTAPLQAGTYKSVWQAYSPLGQPFGDPISLLVEVGP
jgi:hypothetical protein